MSLILALLACGAGEQDSPAVTPPDTGAEIEPVCTARDTAPSMGSETATVPSTGETGALVDSSPVETASTHTGDDSDVPPTETALVDTGPPDTVADTADDDTDDTDDTGTAGPELPTCDTGGHDTGPGVPDDTGSDLDCLVVVDTSPVVDTAPPAVPDTAEPGCPVDTAAPACPEVDWIIHAPAWSTQYVKDLGVLPDGDIIVVGTYYRDFTLKAGEPDEVTITEGACAGAYEESWLARIGTDGTIRWAKQITASCDSARALELAIAPCGDIVVAGHYWDEPMTVAPGTPEAVVLPLPEGGQDNWWSVFTQDGVLRFARTMPAPETSDTLDALDVADDGTIYLAGTYEDHITFDPGTPWSRTLQTGGDPSLPDIYVAAYEPFGSLRWVKAAGTGDTGHATINGLAALSDGPVLVSRADDTSIWGACEPGQSQVDEVASRRTIRAQLHAVDGSLLSATTHPGDPILAGRMGQSVAQVSTAASDIEVAGSFFAQYQRVLFPSSATGEATWAVGGDNSFYARDLSAGSDLIALSGEIAHYPGSIGDFEFGCGPTVEAPDVPFGSVNMQGFAWYTFTDAGEPLCGGWFGSVAANDGQGIVIDHEGGLVIGATWWGDGKIGAGTPAETLISTTDYDIVIVRLAPP